jgi:hypothetical protein
VLRRLRGGGVSVGVLGGFPGFESNEVDLLDFEKVRSFMIWSTIALSFSSIMKLVMSGLEMKNGTWWLNGRVEGKLTGEMREATRTYRGEWTIVSCSLC